MLSTDRLKEIAKEMGIKVEDSDAGLHYIIDEKGNKQELDVNKLFKRNLRGEQK